MVATRWGHSTFIDSETGRRDLRLDRALHVPGASTPFGQVSSILPFRRLVGIRKGRVDMPGIDVAAG